MDQFAAREELMVSMERQTMTDKEKLRRRVSYDAVKAFGNNAAAAWDYSRAMMLLGDYYIMGYYTYEEAMDKSLELAQRLQSMYGSWDEFHQSYLYGFAFWAGSDPEDPQSEYQYRLQLYQYLKTIPGNPFEVLGWNLAFTKDW